MSNIEWSLSVKGGFLSRINVTANGTIETIETGCSKSLKTPIGKIKRGFGKVNINVTTNILRLGNDPIQQSVEVKGFVFGRLIIMQTFSI
ncbi:MAG: hypothetical protein KAS76_01700 [Thermoplasmatales archaeon]|nr:hypothetical protein [Thermoplasmatales archaeon]